MGILGGSLGSSGSLGVGNHIQVALYVVFFFWKIKLCVTPAICTSFNETMFWTLIIFFGDSKLKKICACHLLGVVWLHDLVTMSLIMNERFMFEHSISIFKTKKEMLKCLFIVPKYWKGIDSAHCCWFHFNPDVIVFFDFFGLSS